MVGKWGSIVLFEFVCKLRIWVNKNVCIWGVFLIVSYVGGDIVVDFVVIDVVFYDELMMFVDVGMNIEVVFGMKDYLVIVSCLVGLVFEGGLVMYGMLGCDGVIELIWWVGDGFDYCIIGDVLLSGICGFGLI